MYLQLEFIFVPSHVVNCTIHWPMHAHTCVYIHMYARQFVCMSTDSGHLQYMYVGLSVLTVVMGLSGWLKNKKVNKINAPIMICGDKQIHSLPSYYNFAKSDAKCLSPFNKKYCNHKAFDVA